MLFRSYGKLDRLLDTDPLIFGGHMIDCVGLTESTWAEPPAKFEAGTLPIVQAIGLGTAVEFVESVGIEAVASHEHELMTTAIDALGEVPGLRVLGPAADAGPRGAIVSFTLEGAAAEDIARLLDRRNVFVRHGHHCTMPLHDEIGVMASVRASFAMYNTVADIESLVDGLHYVRQRLRLDR